MVEANSFAVLPPTEIQECNMEFLTSHGKGAPDGIGATVKRCADPIVLRGHCGWQTLTLDYHYIL